MPVLMVSHRPVSPYQHTMQEHPRLQRQHASHCSPLASPQLQQLRQQCSTSHVTASHLTKLLHKAPSVSMILDLVHEHRPQLNEIHAVTALQTIAKRSPARSGFRSHAAWPLLLDAVQGLISRFNARQLSSTLSACGALGIQPAWVPQLLSKAQTSMQEHPEAWSMLTLSTCLSGLGKLDNVGESGVSARAEQLLLPLLHSAKARDISNAVWSFSKREQVLGSDLVAAICLRFLEVLSQADPQNVANLLYGFASMGAAPSEQLLDACAERLVSTVDDATAQNIANAIWALGKLEHRPSAGMVQALLQAFTMQVRRTPVCA